MSENDNIATEMKINPGSNLGKVFQKAKVLVDLCNDPQKGLMAWNEALHRTALELKETLEYWLEH